MSPSRLCIADIIHAAADYKDRKYLGGNQRITAGKVNSALARPGLLKLPMYHDTQFDPEPGSYRVRSSERQQTSFRAVLVRDGHDDLEVQVSNFSRAGFLATSETQLASRTFLWLRLPHVGDVASEVKWCRGRFIGCEFDRGLTSRQYLTILRDPCFPKTAAGGNKILAALAKLVSR